MQRRDFITLLVVAATVLLAQTNIQAANLTVVSVNAPKINCIFDASCTVVVSDSVGSLENSPLGEGARLQSRTFVAKPGTPAAGNTAYLYRVDLIQASGSAECLVGLVIDFGPVVQLPYTQSMKADIFVITTGGIGSVGIANATQDGGLIQFNFSRSLCPEESSFFFGLASAKAPISSSATLIGIGKPSIIPTVAKVPLY